MRMISHNISSSLLDISSMNIKSQFLSLHTPLLQSFPRSFLGRPHLYSYFGNKHKLLEIVIGMKIKYLKKSFILKNTLLFWAILQMHF